MKHTPGPWFAFKADYRRDHAGSPLPIFVVGPQEFHTVAQVRAGNEDDDLPAQTEANARLIAAAPDLLAILKELVEVFEWSERRTRPDWDGAASENSTLGRARIDIAKAETP